GPDPENVVRVDARRLRQILELHYKGTGRDDPVQLHLDSGGYRPRFETKGVRPNETARQKSFRSMLPVATFAGGAIVGAALAAVLVPEPLPEPQVATGSPGVDTTEILRRAAIYDKSPASLQAFNLAQQARGMIFPIFDRPRQELVLSVFERVITLDPDYFGGYAGAAQALASLAVVSPPDPAGPNYGDAAIQMAQEAIRLAPGEAWSQSAMSWAQFSQAEFDQALRFGRRAAQLDAQDGHALDFLGAVALFSGAFEEALELAERDLYKDSSNQRFANRNVAGAAHFHLGNFDLTDERFEQAANIGDPLSAPSIAYHAAALSALGRDHDARDKLAELERAWPNVPVDRVLARVHSNPAYAEDVIAELRSMGWEPIQQ
ncbi:MAG: tetratricopeptide repeat protein, partial [Ruegeria sp.]